MKINELSTSNWIGLNSQFVHEENGAEPKKQFSNAKKLTDHLL